jgi:hypothetical protein
MNTSMPLVSAAALGVVSTAFAKIIRPWYLTWGATGADLHRGMPLDDRVPCPNLSNTMAIAIDAPPEHIWPWLVQIGDPPRAGYYSYTWIERMVGLHVENRDVILPEFQSVQIGEALDRNGTMRVLFVDPGHTLVVGPPASEESVQSTWAFGLYPVDGRTTRLVTRVHGRMHWPAMLRRTPPYAWPFYLLIEPGAFLMERKMLREIKRRVDAAELLAAGRSGDGLGDGAERIAAIPEPVDDSLQRGVILRGGADMHRRDHPPVGLGDQVVDDLVGGRARLPAHAVDPPQHRPAVAARHAHGAGAVAHAEPKRGVLTAAERTKARRLTTGRGAGMWRS